MPPDVCEIPVCTSVLVAFHHVGAFLSQCPGITDMISPDENLMNCDIFAFTKTISV